MSDPSAVALSALLAVPAARVGPLTQIRERLLAAERVVLTTHVNADGDGIGAEVAVAAWLEARGLGVTIVNPTPFPDAYRFLLYRAGLVAELDEPAADEALQRADLVFVLDTSEPRRVEALLPWLTPERTLVMDHHPPGPECVGTLALRDETAAATGELVYDLLTLAGDAWPSAAVLGAYVALVFDTGSFRHGNTTPRVHLIAAELMRRGVDPEEVYRRLFGSLPLRRIHLLRSALGSMRCEDDICWMLVPNQAVEEVAATPEDLDGLVEYARSVEGTEVAILFRETAEGHTKMSLRSNGGVDVNRVARQFGGGGHVKASGALVEEPPPQVVPRVLAAVREELGE